jgi:hypothetical protein
MKSSTALMMGIPISLFLLMLTFNTTFVSPYNASFKNSRAKISLFGQCFFDESFAACRDR